MRSASFTYVRVFTHFYRAEGELGFLLLRDSSFESTISVWTLERCSCHRNAAMLTARADVEQLGDDTVFEGHLWSDVEAVERFVFSCKKSLRSARQTTEGGMGTCNAECGRQTQGHGQSNKVSSGSSGLKFLSNQPQNIKCIRSD